MPRKRLIQQISDVFSPRGEGAAAPASEPPEIVEGLRRENLRLTRALDELSMLNELAREIGASRSTDAIMDRIIRRSLRSVNAAQAVITLVNEQSREPMKTLVRAAVTSSEHEQFHLNQNLLGWMHLHKRPLLSNSPSTDERFRGITWDPSIRSILCVPLIVKTALIGVLTVYNKKNTTEFTEEDQRVITIIAMQSAQVIENARLYEEETKLKDMEEEIRLASRIQMELLPSAAPAIAHYDIAGRSIPARQIGGDYFDFIAVEGDKLAVCLGDVSGKGLPASLLMANLQATLRSQTLLNVAPREGIRRSNRMLYKSTDPEKFATLFYGILDLATHKLTYTNAGHENPFLFGPGGPPARLETGGTVLGVVETFDFDEATVDLVPGSVLVMFSDGITEAFDAGDTQFGEKSLADVIAKHRHESSEALINHIVSAVKTHVGDAPQGDDLTLVVIKRDTA
jgi:sigma-B regulation protein RsbU (phosphoserine phosphatase)